VKIFLKKMPKRKSEEIHDYETAWKWLAEKATLDDVNKLFNTSFKSRRTMRLFLDVFNTPPCLVDIEKVKSIYQDRLQKQEQVTKKRTELNALKHKLKKEYRQQWEAIYQKENLKEDIWIQCSPCYCQEWQGDGSGGPGARYFGKVNSKWVRAKMMDNFPVQTEFRGRDITKTIKLEENIQVSSLILCPSLLKPDLEVVKLEKGAKYTLGFDPYCHYGHYDGKCVPWCPHGFKFAAYPAVNSSCELRWDSKFAAYPVNSSCELRWDPESWYSCIPLQSVMPIDLVLIVFDFLLR
jgi:hypothetical protein